MSAIVLAACVMTAQAQRIQAQRIQAQRAQASLAAGVPLHVTVTRTAKMCVGAPVAGFLSQPIWVKDRLVLPAGAPVFGTVTALEPVPRGDRVRALLDGDLTPLHAAVVDFSSVRVGTADLVLTTEARVRQTETVRFVAQKKTSLFGKARGLLAERVHTVRIQLTGPGKKDRALRLFYNQLPYHPQRIWRGTAFIADLTASAQVDVPRQAEPVQVPGTALLSSLPPNTVVKGRLVTALDSDSSQRGDLVTALVTEPVFGPTRHGQPQQLLLPEGAELEGSVQRTKPSRSFGRNGTLRFTFRGVRRPGEQTQKVRGTLTGADGSPQGNLSVDAEGDVKAQPDKNRFAAPLLLAALAAAGHDEDGGAGRQVVAANGLGLVARIVTLAVRDNNVASGLGAYGFAKSIYFRFVARGHAVSFPKDTQVEVQLSSR